MQTSNNNPTVQIISNENGTVLTATKNPEIFYMRVKSESISINPFGGFANKTVKSAIINGPKDVLESLIAQSASSVGNGKLAGKVAVLEMTESEFHSDVRFSPLKAKCKDMSNEEIVNRHGKRAVNNGPVLTSNNERILRFSVYDQSATLPDRLVAHDRVTSSAAPKAALTPQSAEAAFPG